MYVCMYVYIRRPADSKGEHVREEITSSSGLKAQSRGQGARAIRVDAESNVGHDQLQAERDPSFSGTLVQCGGRVHFGSLGNHFWSYFLWIQKATFGMSSCRRHSSFTGMVLQCGGGVPFLEGWEIILELVSCA